MFASLTCQEEHACPPGSRTRLHALGVAGLLAVAMVLMLMTSVAAQARTKVLLVHGGAWIGGSPASMDPLRDQLRTHGIASKSVSYRVDESGFIPAQVGRVRRAVRAEKKRGNRVILYGVSAGGHLSLALAARGEVDGAVAIAPPTDLLTLLTVLGVVPAQFGMSSLQAYQMSPLRRLTKRAAPTLLLHGDGDRLVPLEHSEKYFVAARRYQRDVALITMHGVGHHSPPLTYQDRASKWIEHRMR